MVQTVKKQWSSATILLLSLFVANTALAVDGNRYRAELVLVERLASEQDVGERMQSRRPSTPATLEKTLLAFSDSGTAYSDIDLVPMNELHLSSAVQRLKNSGRFRILMAAGWYESFPPNYQGEQLRVAIGEQLPTGDNGEERREVEGFISIDRQRYLHVTARLNHWEKTPPAELTNTDSRSVGQGSSPSNTRNTVEPAKAAESTIEGDSANQATDSMNGKATDPASVVTGSQVEGTAPGEQAETSPIQLRTWLHETRRMRSEEIHYLDSPSIGLLVYFEPVEEEPGEPAQPEQPGNSSQPASGGSEPASVDQ